MATHSSILAWEIPRTEEPRGLQPMGLQSQTRHPAQQSSKGLDELMNLRRSEKCQVHCKNSQRNMVNSILFPLKILLLLLFGMETSSADKDQFPTASCV